MVHCSAIGDDETMMPDDHDLFPEDLQGEDSRTHDQVLRELASSSEQFWRRA